MTRTIEPYQASPPAEIRQIWQIILDIHSLALLSWLKMYHSILFSLTRCTSLFIDITLTLLPFSILFSYFHFLKYGRFSHHPCSLPQNVKPPVEYFPTNKTEMSLEDRQPSGAVTDQSQIGNHHYSNQRLTAVSTMRIYQVYIVDVLEGVADDLLPEKSLDR